MVLIFTVELFHSAIRHREAHFCVCLCRQAGGTFLEPDNNALVVDELKIQPMVRHVKLKMELKVLSKNKKRHHDGVLLCCWFEPGLFLQVVDDVVYIIFKQIHLSDHTSGVNNQSQLFCIW